MKQKRNLEDTRERILGTAQHIFSEKGLEGARIEEIAEAAGISKAMIYYLFPSKEELYKTVLRLVFESLSEAVRQAIDVAADPDMDDIANAVGTYFQLVMRNADVARILLRELTNRGTYWRQIREENPEHFAVLGLAIAKIYHLMDKGVLRRVQPDRYILAVLGATLVISVFQPISDLLLARTEDFSQEVDLERWQEVVTDMLLQSLAGRGKSDE